MYNPISRRKFLQSTTGLLALAYAGSSFSHKKEAPLLSFSTLGCPDWTFTQILDFAATHHYNGIELRGIQRQLDLQKCDEFSSPQKIKETMRLVSNKRLAIVNLGSSASLHHDAGAEREKHLGEAKRFIDLAAQMNCPYIRVFPNNFPKDKSQEAVIDNIVTGLTLLGDYAKETAVTVLMETHGDLVKTADLKKIMELTSHKKVGLIWDIVNMWSVTREPPAQAYAALKPYIRHSHIKDAITTAEKPQYTLLGKGDTPVFEAIRLLLKSGYKGYYSFEWEKLWHPEIAEPETAIADYAKVMRQHFFQKALTSPGNL